MSDFINRLMVEREELAIKITKLEEFLESKKSLEIEEDQLVLLNIQVKAMDTYHECLHFRINKLRK